MNSQSSEKSLPRLAYSIAEACKATGLSSVYIHKLFNEGTLIRRKVGKRTFILASDLEAFLRSRPSAKWTAERLVTAGPDNRLTDAE